MPDAPLFLSSKHWCSDGPHLYKLRSDFNFYPGLRGAAGYVADKKWVHGDIRRRVFPGSIPARTKPTFSARFAVSYVSAKLCTECLCIKSLAMGPAMRNFSVILKKPSNT